MPLLFHDHAVNMRLNLQVRDWSRLLIERKAGREMLSVINACSTDWRMHLAVKA